MKNLEISYLMDFYGNLLSDKQRDIMQLYYGEDLSLAEISFDEDITRQGVRDAIKRAVEKLQSFEDALGFVKKATALKDALLKFESSSSSNDLEALKSEINNL